jgi:isopenicillin N synthase-like dioxygenase
MNTERIPVLDVADFLAGKPGAREILAQAVAHTCDDTGFLVITNHGIRPELIDGAFAAASDFFDMDEHRKLALKRPEHRISTVWRAGRAHVEGEQQHQVEPQREFLYRYGPVGG